MTMVVGPMPMAEAVWAAGRYANMTEGRTALFYARAMILYGDSIT